MLNSRIKYHVVLTVAFIFFFDSYSHGQVFSDDLNMGGANMNSQLALIGTKDETIAIKGNPFIFKEFEKGNVNFYSNEISDVSLRINLLNNTVEFLRRDNVYRFTNYDSVQSFVIDDRVFIPIREKFTDDYSVYELIHETDNYRIVKLQSYFFQEKVAAKSSYEKEIPAEFVENNPKYYFLNVNEGNRLIEVSDRRQIKDDEVLPYSSVKKFLRGNRLKSDEDVIMFFEDLRENKLLSF